MRGSLGTLEIGAGPVGPVEAAIVTRPSPLVHSPTSSVTAIGAFKDPVTFSCAGLPAGAACNFNPVTVTPGTNGPVASTLTITTQARSSAALALPRNGTFAFAFGLPILGIALAGMRLRTRGRLQTGIRSQECRKPAIVLALLVIVLLALQGCAGVSGHSQSNSAGSGNVGGGAGTPSGTYTVTVAATSGGSPAITHAQTITLTVQ